MSAQVIIDATGKSPGRVATEAVRVLMGKTDPSWAPNRAGETVVVVVHAENLRITPVKLRTKVYRTHAGGPGGLREVPLKRIAADRPEEVLRHAISGMLPSNRLHAKAMRRLRIVRGAGE